MDDTNQFTKEKAFRVSGFERLPMVRKSLGIIHGLIKSTGGGKRGHASTLDTTALNGAAIVQNDGRR